MIYAEPFGEMEENPVEWEPYPYDELDEEDRQNRVREFEEQFPELCKMARESAAKFAESNAKIKEDQSPVDAESFGETEEDLSSDIDLGGHGALRSYIGDDTFPPNFYYADFEDITTVYHLFNLIRSIDTTDAKTASKALKDFTAL